MIKRTESLAALVDRIEVTAPDYIDLVTSQTDSDFDQVFDKFLEKAVIGLETNKKLFIGLDEDGLSGVLALALTQPGLTVLREAHSNGHVDLTIEVEHCMPARKWLGEAKIYDGPEKHLGGLAQLLNRYTTGREGRGFVIAYCKKQKIVDLMKKIREKMDADRPLQQIGDTIDHVIKWSFISTHAHTSGEKLSVGHIGCNLFVEPTESSSVKAD